MGSRLTLTTDERKALLVHVRRSPAPALRLRAHLLLLLADGYAWAPITAVLFCRTRAVARWQQRFLRDRVAGVAGRDRPAPAGWATPWAAVVVRGVMDKTPRAFGYFRSRWSCALLAPVLGQPHRVAVGRETIRRWRHQKDLVGRRPRPALGRRDPDREARSQGLRQRRRDLPANETAGFQDEADVTLNPKIGGRGMPEGPQAEVVTPGDNATRYLAGSLNWRTGAVIVTHGPKRDGDLFARHLHDLRRRLRRYRTAQVIRDNAGFHTDCGPVWAFVAKHGDRVVLRFLPTDAPDCNPIERGRRARHEQVTRNHRCKNLDELVELVEGWLDDPKVFPVEDKVYTQRAAARATFPTGKLLFRPFRPAAGRRQRSGDTTVATGTRAHLACRYAGCRATSSIRRPRSPAGALSCRPRKSA